MVLKTTSMSPPMMQLRRTVFGHVRVFSWMGGCPWMFDAHVVYARTRAWVVRGHR